MNASRRDFLKSSSLVIGASAAAGFTASQKPLFGADTEDPEYSKKKGWNQKDMPTLVTIFLRGGADALNVLVPFGDPLYYKYRPSIGIAARDTKNKKGCIQLNSDYFGMNPAVASLMPMFNEGSAAIINNVGSKHGTRSHFDAQDYMERAAPGIKSMQEGWLARYLRQTQKPTDEPLRGLAPNRLLPRSMRGRYPVLAGYNNTEQMQTFEALYAQTNMVNMTAREGARVRGSTLADRNNDDSQSGGKIVMRKKLRTSEAARDIIAESGTNSVARIKALKNALATQKNTARYPRGGLGRQLSTIAKVIKANVGLEVAAADYGGWDHHANQGDVNGRMSTQLKHVSDSIAAFNEDLGPLMESVVVLTMSEFGRTVRENGSNGTDHGHGGFMFAVGGPVQGKKLYGKWIGLEQLNRGRYLPTTTDFRTVFGECLSKLFYFDYQKEKFFPKYASGASKQLGFLKQFEIGK